jgi:hypothetical protein
MSRRTIATLVVCLGLLGPTSVRAHHSAVLFDLSKTFTMTGTMTKVDWRNPHIEVFVEARSDAGRVEAWELETGAPAWFRTRNLAKSNLERAIGGVVVVEGVRAKDGSLYGYLYAIIFSDGTRWDLR